MESMKDILTEWRQNVLLAEHRGVPCDEKTGSERVECEKKHKEAVERGKENHRKKRAYSASEEELDALGKGKVYGMNPKIKITKGDYKPKGKIELDKLAKGELDEKKSHCEPRNKWHSQDGKFSSKEDATSWSGSNPKNKSNCSYGWSQSKGSGERLATKLPCGREGGKQGKPNPNKKAPWKCKNKERYWTEQINELLIEEPHEGIIDAEDWVLIRKSTLTKLMDKHTKNILDDYERHLDEQEVLLSEEPSQKQVAYCNKLGLRTFRQYLDSINALERAQEGELYDEPKKSKK